MPTQPGASEQARTRQARAAVVAAARDEFTADGYAASTIAAISGRSGVPAATVYRLFGSKLGILKAVLDVAIAGDDEDVAVADRPAVRDALAEPDPADRLAGFVRVATAINQRIAGIYRILVSAADADPDARALLAELARQRQRGQRLVVDSLAASGQLRPEVSARDAADVVHALMSPDVYRLLVGDRGWTPERYSRWLTATVSAQLLP